MSRNSNMRRSMLTEMLEGQPARKKHKTVPAVPISTLMLDSQRALDEKRYKDAVRYLSQALNNLQDRKSDLLHVYDLRSGAYVKLDQLQNALQDAKQMIRLDKVDARGYIRCAQVEQLYENSKGAIKVIEYGLRSVPSADKGHARLELLLVRIKDAGRKRVVYEKGTDPMQVLPTELLDIILATFDYRQAVAVMRVCKSWRSRLRSSDLITQTIDTQQSRQTMTYEQTKAAFARVGKRPKLLALAKLNDNAARFASSELGHWVRWESLETLILEEGKMQLSKIRWEKLSNLRKLATGSALEMTQTISGLLAKCPSLQEAELKGNLCKETVHMNHMGGLPPEWTTNQNLRTLAIRSSVAEHMFSLPYTCPFPNLESLHLANLSICYEVDLSSYSNLKHLVLRNASIDDRYNLRTPASLESFTLEGKFANIFPQPEELKFPCSNLKAISTRGADSIRFLSYAIRQGLSKDTIRSICIADFVSYSNVAGRLVCSDLNLLQSIPGSEVFQNVETLALKDDNMSDNHLAVIHSLFPAVQNLELEAPFLTEAFVSDLVRFSSNQVTNITLRNCTSVSGSIVKWAQARNVNVKIVRQAWQGEASGGKRVRHN